MVIIIDTNAIHDDHHLKSASWALLCGAREKVVFDILVPEIVVLEHAKHLRKARELAVEGLDDAVGMASKVFATSVELSSQQMALRTAPDDAEERIRARLRELSVRVLAHPRCTTNELVRRAVLRRRPFKEDGSGYQDTLIWLSALEWLGSAGPVPVVLVSNDSGFWEQKHTGLHSKLKEEAEATPGFVSFSISNTLTEAFDTHVRPHLDRVQQVEAELASAEGPASLAKWLREHLGDALIRHFEQLLHGPQRPFQLMDPVEIEVRQIEASAIDEHNTYVRATVTATGATGGWVKREVSPDYFEDDWWEDDIAFCVVLAMMRDRQGTLSAATVIDLKTRRLPGAKGPEKRA